MMWATTSWHRIVRSGQRLPSVIPFRSVRSKGLNQPLVRLEGGSREPKWSQLTKPLLFTLGFGLVTLNGAFIYKYELLRSQALKKRNAIVDFFESLQSPSMAKAGDWRRELNQLWNSLDDGHRLFVPIFAANLAVFLLWRLPSLTPVMTRVFCSNPSAKTGTCWPMLFSAFSHYGPMHLGFNMFCLQSIMPPLVSIMGKEHFLGVYLTAAVVSSMASYVFKIASGLAGLSLGASGAIFCLLGIYGTLMPDAMMQFIFLPWYPFTAASAIKGLALFDTVGLIAGWKFLDHAAHLGGLLFGVFWIKYGLYGVQQVVQKWHQHRNKPT